MLKVTIIGAGNIGGATALGLATSADVTATARTETTLKRLEGRGVRTSTNNITAVQSADIVIFAVKPWLMEEVVKSVSPSLDLKKQIIVSMAPGIASSDIIDWLGSEVRLAYIIPNTAIEVGESMTFVVPITTDPQSTEMLVNLFSNAGKVMSVSENRLMAGTLLASCGIAYALDYIKASAVGGEKLGFNSDEAVEIVSQTVKGATAILDAHDSKPQVEIDRVTTPGGITIRGLQAMEESGFTDAVISGLTIK